MNEWVGIGLFVFFLLICEWLEARPQSPPVREREAPTAEPESRTEPEPSRNFVSRDRRTGGLS